MPGFRNDLLVTDVIDRLNDAKFQEFAVFVKAFGVHANLAEMIYQHFGPSAMTVLQADPYRLVWEVAGIGFNSKFRFSLWPPDNVTTNFSGL